MSMGFGFMMILHFIEFSFFRSMASKKSSVSYSCWHGYTGSLILLDQGVELGRLV
jgi:hypothetical protein